LIVIEPVASLDVPRGLPDGQGLGSHNVARFLASIKDTGVGQKEVFYIHYLFLN